MLLGVPKILSPEILSMLCEMGHSDVIVVGDANFPANGSLRRATASSCARTESRAPTCSKRS